MTNALRIARAKRVVKEGLTYIEVELENGSTSLIASGGVRMRVERSYRVPLYVSASNHWPIGPGGLVYLTAIVPSDSLKHVDFVEYIGADGTLHTLGDRLSIGWFSCELKRGTVGADVQA